MVVAGQPIDSAVFVETGDVDRLVIPMDGLRHTIESEDILYLAVTVYLLQEPMEHGAWPVGGR